MSKYLQKTFSNLDFFLNTELLKVRHSPYSSDVPKFEFLLLKFGIHLKVNFEHVGDTLRCSFILNAFTQPLHTSKMGHKPIFKQSLTDLIFRVSLRHDRLPYQVWRTQAARLFSHCWAAQWAGAVESLTASMQRLRPKPTSIMGDNLTRFWVYFYSNCIVSLYEFCYTKPDGKRYVKIAIYRALT